MLDTLVLKVHFELWIEATNTGHQGDYRSHTAFTLDKTEHGKARHSTGAMPSACAYTAIVKVGPKHARN